MGSKTFTGNNNLSMKCSEKLYLDSKTSDVNFVIKVNDVDSESVPAHKIILAVGSPVFDAMFYGSMKEKGDVKIVDTSLGAFNEFLQLFYLGKVNLSSENIIGVTKLCHKYDVTDGLALCENALLKTLTLGQMLKGYELAILHELKKVVKFCELKIKQNPDIILESDDLLDLSRDRLGEILKLVSSKGRALVILDACLDWARAACERKGVEATTENVKNEIGSLINQIPLNFSRIDDICRVYEAAILLDMKSTIKLCEQKIMQNSVGILKSAELLKCNQKTLEKILKLVSNCNASIIVESCMKWVKCQKNVEATAANQKIEFGSSLFGQVPFAKLSNEEFAEFIVSNKNLLNDADLKAIILNVMNQKDKIVKGNDKIAMETQIATPVVLTPRFLVGKTPEIQRNSLIYKPSPNGSVAIKRILPAVQKIDSASKMAKLEHDI